MNGACITVLVAHTDEGACTRTCDALETPGIRVVAVAHDGEEAIQLALDQRPSVCLIDFDSPNRMGLAAAAVLARVLDNTSVVLLAEDLTMADVLDAVRVGAAGCLPKDADGPALADAVRAAAAGEISFPARELRQALGFLVPQVA